MSDLFHNAVESIVNGVEDFLGKRPERISSALRNLYAGVLLLLKEKLVRESPAGSDGILIYSRFLPRRTPTGVILVPSGNNTVDVFELQQRFKALHLNFDWGRLERLQKIRNDVEHHKLKHPEAMVREALASTFRLVASVLIDHLDADPVKVLGRTWQAMLTEASLFKELDEECRTSRKRLEEVPKAATEAVVDFLRCPSCDSSLIAADEETYWNTMFTCRACGARSDLAQAMPSALALAYPETRHWDPHDPPPVHPIRTCPSCGEEAYALEEDLCLVCSESRPYKECARCEEPLSIDEQDSGLCSYCDHVMSRDD